MIAPTETLPELTEADAPPTVRAVYRGLREGASSPITALIWRHIATHPGLIEASWVSLEPLFASGRMADTAWRIAREGRSRGMLPRIEPRARAFLGMSSDAVADIQAVVEAYNRVNPVNLLAIQTLLARLRDDAPPVALPAFASKSPPPPIEREIRRMTMPAEMSADLRWLLNDLRLGDVTQLDAVVPSLYRHLTDWPAYLAVLHVALAPCFRNGTMAAEVARLQSAMNAEAAELARCMAPVPALAAHPRLQVTMRRFTGGFIPMMAVVGQAMAEQLA